MTLSRPPILGPFLARKLSEDNVPQEPYQIWWFGDRHADVGLMGMVPGTWHGCPATYFLFGVHFNKSRVPEFDLDVFCCRQNDRFYGQHCFFKWKWKGPVPGVAPEYPPGNEEDRDQVHYYAYIFGGPRHYRMERKLTTRRFWPFKPTVTQWSAFRVTDSMKCIQPILAIFHKLHSDMDEGYRQMWDSDQMIVSELTYDCGEEPEEVEDARTRIHEWILGMSHPNDPFGYENAPQPHDTISQQAWSSTPASTTSSIPRRDSSDEDRPLLASTNRRSGRQYAAQYVQARRGRQAFYSGPRPPDYVSPTPLLGWRDHYDGSLVLQSTGRIYQRTSYATPSAGFAAGVGSSHRNHVHGADRSDQVLRGYKVIASRPIAPRASLSRHSAMIQTDPPTFEEQSVDPSLLATTAPPHDASTTPGGVSTIERPPVPQRQASERSDTINAIVRPGSREAPWRQNRFERVSGRDSGRGIKGESRMRACSSCFRYRLILLDEASTPTSSEWSGVYSLVGFI